MIPFFDYRRQWNEHRNEILATIQRVLDSGQLILGPEVQAFEREFAAAIGAPHAIGVNSGTDALVLALRSLGIGPGDEVITVPNTAVPTLAAIRISGARPVLVDIEPDTLLMNMQELPRACTSRTKAIIPVHLHGLAVDLEELFNFARERKIAVIEDCAQSFGADYRGQAVGTFGMVGCFSFYPTKNLGAFGDGGLCTSPHEELAERLRKLRMYGFNEKAEAVIDGFNSRLDEMQAAILRFKLQHFAGHMQKRLAIAHRYLAELDRNRYRLPTLKPDRTHAFHIFAIRSSRRQLLKEKLAQRGILTGIHYARPVHLMPAYADLGYGLGDLPVAEKAAEELLSLPLFPELSEEEQSTVISSLNEVDFNETS